MLHASTFLHQRRSDGMKVAIASYCVIIQDTDTDICCWQYCLQPGSVSYLRAERFHTHTNP